MSSIQKQPQQYQVQNNPVSITLANSPYTVPANVSEVNVNTAGGNVTVTVPVVARQIKINKTSSDSYIVQTFSTENGEVAGEFSGITYESGRITKDEPWYPFDTIVGIAGVPGDGGEVIAKNKFGKVRTSGRGVAQTDDRTILQLAAALGGKIMLSGAFKISSGTNYISPVANTEIVGVDKMATTLENIRFLLTNVNIALKNFTMKGTALPTGYDIAIINTSAGGGICQDLYIDQWQGLAALQLYPNNKTIYNCVYKDVEIYRPSGSGVYNNGTGSHMEISHILYDNVKVWDAGVYNNCNSWALGIDFSEGITVTDVEAFNCKVYGAYESCFHIEAGSTINGLRLIQCYAERGGQKPVPLFGAGYTIMAGDISPTILDGCVSVNNATRGYNLNLVKNRGIVVNNCFDYGSHRAFVVSGVVGNCFMNDCTSDSAADYGAYFSTASNIYCKNLRVIDPIGDIDNIGVYLGVGAYPVTNSDIDIHVVRGPLISIAAQNLANCRLSGSIYQPGVVGNEAALFLTSPSNVLVDGFRVNCVGYYGIMTHGIITNTVFKNITFQDQISGTMVKGIFNDGTGNPTVERRSIKNMGAVTTLYTGCSFSDVGSGSSTGTGVEQTLAHNLIVIPVGCKAWIKIPISATRFFEREVDFDATNIYPCVNTGVVYDWGIGAQ